MLVDSGNPGHLVVEKELTAWWKSKIHTQFPLWLRSSVGKLERATRIRKTLAWVRFPAGLRCVFSSDPAVSSSIFVGAEREENLIRNNPDKSEFTIMYTAYFKTSPCAHDQYRLGQRNRATDIADPTSCTCTSCGVRHSVSPSRFISNYVHACALYILPWPKKFVTDEIFMRLIRSAIMWYHATSTSIYNASSRRADTAGRVDVEPKLDSAWYHMIKL